MKKGGRERAGTGRAVQRQASGADTSSAQLASYKLLVDRVHPTNVQSARREVTGEQRACIQAAARAETLSSRLLIPLLITCATAADCKI